jgi:hypothetical protein
VVIDCVAYPVEGKVVDPVAQMKAFLLGKKVGAPAWLNRAGDAFRRRIAVAAKQKKLL